MRPDVEGGVEGDERVEQEVAVAASTPVPGVLGERQEGHERPGRGEGAPQRRPVGARRAARGRRSQRRRRGAARRPRGRASGRPATRLSQKARGAEGRSQGDDERRVERGPDEPLEREARQDDEGGREEQEGGQGVVQVARRSRVYT